MVVAAAAAAAWILWKAGCSGGLPPSAQPPGRAPDTPASHPRPAVPSLLRSRFCLSTCSDLQCLGAAAGCRVSQPRPALPGPANRASAPPPTGGTAGGGGAVRGGSLQGDPPGEGSQVERRVPLQAPHLGSSPPSGYATSTEPREASTSREPCKWRSRWRPPGGPTSSFPPPGSSFSALLHGRALWKGSWPWGATPSLRTSVPPSSSRPEGGARGRRICLSGEATPRTSRPAP